jgi:cell division protein FtsI (penicillin-binding protein 3)
LDVKRDILWRVYLSYLLVVVACVAIFGKAVYIQQVQGTHWRSMSDSLHQKLEEIEAERGTIYSADGEMLSTSIPQFDLYMDFRVASLHEKNGFLFRSNLDSLSVCMADLFKDQSAGEYKQLFQEGYQNDEGYLLLKRKISYREYEQLKKFPLFRLGRYKSGLIANERTVRLNPYQMLAFRTIGLARDENKVGLEKEYDSLLKGRNGKQFVRRIAGGVNVPVDDTYEIEPESGKDIVSTLDVFIQDVTENALMNMMVQNEAQTGCAIVMETKTGKIRAIANLGKTASGNYRENYNYALTPTEPGSTFKLVTMLSLLEDKKISLNQIVDVQHGVWQVAGQTVRDDDDTRDKTTITVKQAFEVSSNVGMAKIATMGYSSSPKQYLSHLKKLRMDTLTGIDLTGEKPPVIIRPGSRLWGPTTLPWMAFGYNVKVSPLQTITPYNAIANGGKMMRPYLVSSINDEGQLLKTIDPYVVDDKICSPETLRQIRECLEGVCIEGTARKLFLNSAYKVAGKTGTALMANGNRGYADRIFQSSFVGYFPAEAPQYTIAVIIVNKPHAVNHFGASVAGPVFREIADRLYSRYIRQTNMVSVTPKKDSSAFIYTGNKKDITYIDQQLQLPFIDSTMRTDQWINMQGKNARVIISPKPKADEHIMPLLKGMGLKDVVYICENSGLKVSVKGRGKVIGQSIPPGQAIARGELISIELN